MVIGENLFEKARGSDPLYKLVIEGNYKAFWEKVFKMSNQTFSVDLKNLIEGMICCDPS